MKRQRVLTGSIGALVLGGLLYGSWVAPAWAQTGPVITGNWDKNYPSGKRFVVLADFGNAAVLDKNTGLVWEQAPDATNGYNWDQAIDYCVNKEVGGTAGWRLPSVVELKSVQDPSLPAPLVPLFAAGGVFTGVTSSNYWSASTLAGNPATTSVAPTIAWKVSFANGFVTFGFKTGFEHAWCVRGPMRESVY